jgi:type II secretory pathway pseudopilin PulG
MHTPSRSRIRQAGISIIEFLAVLALIGVALFFALRNVDRADTNQTTNAFITQMISLSRSVQDTYKFNQYTGMTTSNFINGGNAPTEMVNGATLRHQHNGTVALAPANCNGGTANCFTMTAANVPGAACSVALGALHSQLFSITVGTTVVKSGTVAYTQSAANDACNAASVSLVMTKA